MTAQSPVPHEIIASDAYWTAPVEQYPTISTQAGMKDEIIDRRSDAVVRLMTALSERAERGCSITPVNSGELLPIFDSRDGAMIKVITDYRRTKQKIGRFTKRGSVEPEEFDELAVSMIHPGLYRGSGATTLVENNAGIAVIGRYVGYYRSASSGLQLSGVDSSEIGNRRQSGYNDIMPPLTVEQIYRRGKNVLKVMHAEIILPHGLQHVRKKAKVEERKTSFGLVGLPRTLPGIA